MGAGCGAHLAPRTPHPADDGAPAPASPGERASIANAPPSPPSAHAAQAEARKRARELGRLANSKNLIGTLVSDAPTEGAEGALPRAELLTTSKQNVPGQARAPPGNARAPQERCSS